MEKFNFYADTARGYKEMAKELRNNRQYDEAEEVLRAGLEQFPDDAHLLNAMGRRHRAKWRDEEALECFERAYSLLPGDAFIACDYADFLNKQGRPDEAELVYLRAFDDETEIYSRDNQFVLVGLGNVYQRTQRYALAAVCFGEACKRDPEDETALRRYFEVSSKYGVTHNEAEWEKFMEYAQGIVTEAGEFTPPGPEATP